jgi:hypothetical protein
MDRRFAAFTLDEFSAVLARFAFSRRIAAVHMHHTWRPNHAQWSDERSVLAMWRFHTLTNGWSDIAQHVTIAPDGRIWEGRDWNRAPASASAFNGTHAAGPFMFETVGDFDAGQDVLEGPQRATVVGVIARVLQHFGLGSDALRFHREMTHLKTCPGTSIRLDDVRAEVEAARAALPGATRVRGGSAGRRGRTGLGLPVDGTGDPVDAEPAESLMSEREWRQMIDGKPPARRGGRRRRLRSSAATARRGTSRKTRRPRSRSPRPTGS